MKICFPVEHNVGLNSKVFGHFGSAPLFLIVDAQTREIAEEINRDQHHEHGKCNPVAALGGRNVDAAVVGGIGGGALNGLTMNGIAVFRAEGETVAENLDKIVTTGLKPMSPAHTCGGHAHGGGCSHG